MSEPIPAATYTYCAHCGHLGWRHASKAYWPEGPCLDCRLETNKLHGRQRQLDECCQLTSDQVSEGVNA